MAREVCGKRETHEHALSVPIRSSEERLEGGGQGLFDASIEEEALAPLRHATEYHRVRRLGTPYRLKQKRCWTV